MATTSSGGEPAHATADREIVISRVIGAPRELVFEAFTRVRHLSRWWGPEGFTTKTRSFEFRVGGEWDFVMHGPDGTDYQEWITWREIVPPERIALLHGESRDDPNAFESVLTFEPTGEQTRIVMRTASDRECSRSRAPSPSRAPRITRISGVTGRARLRYPGAGIGRGAPMMGDVSVGRDRGRRR